MTSAQIGSKNPMTFRTIITAAVLFTTFASSAAAEGWLSGYGQGATEAWVELGPGNRIDISCTGGFSHAITGVSFTLAGQPPAANSTVLLIVDDHDPMEVPINSEQELGSNNRVEALWFEAVRDALKGGDSAYVRFADGTGARFPLSGSGKAIGECQADFWRTDLID